MNILIADDDQVFSLILAALLRKLDHQVTTVATGLQAWNAFRTEYRPVVITDYQMPEIDGMVLTRMMRAKPHDRYTYVIMVATQGSKEIYLEAMNAGVDDFLRKPPDEDELIARLLVAERIVNVQTHVRQLEAIMSVCSYCKNVREANHEWVNMEHYVSKHLRTHASHTVCPQCFATQVKPELERLGIRMDEMKLA